MRILYLRWHRVNNVDLPPIKKVPLEQRKRSQESRKQNAQQERANGLSGRAIACFDASTNVDIDEQELEPTLEATSMTEYNLTLEEEEEELEPALVCSTDVSEYTIPEDHHVEEERELEPDIDSASFMEYDLPEADHNLEPILPNQDR